MGSKRLLLLCFVLTATASAQFLWYVSDAQDAATYTDGIAPGAMFVVKGLFPVPAGLRISALPLEQSLEGVSVLLTPAGGGEAIRAWMFYTYMDAAVIQVAAVLPSTTPPGDYDLSVVSGGITAAGGTARVAERKYRSLTNNQEGYGLAVVQNYVSPTQVDRNMFIAGTVEGGQTRAPAQPGQTEILWGLGLGAIPVPDNEAPGVLDLRGQLDVRVSVGGIDAPVHYAGRSPEFPGIDQINFTIPSNAPLGCNVALQVVVNGEAGNPVTMAIAAPGRDACEHPFLSPQQLDDLDQGEPLPAGEFNLTAYVEKVAGSDDLGFLEIHSSIGYFNYMTAGRASTLDFRSIAPGQCSLWRGDETGMAYLDARWDDSASAGNVTVSGPNLPAVPLDEGDSYYYRLFSARQEEGGAHVTGDPNHRLAPGEHVLRGFGGDVGAFEARLQMPELLKWINRDAIAEVRRDTGLELNWSGAGVTDRIIIQGVTLQSAGGANLDTASFVCAAPPGSTSFRVPPAVLQSMPATPDFGTQSAGMLMVAAFSGDSTARFQASLAEGEDIGVGTFGYVMMSSKVLPYR